MSYDKGSEPLLKYSYFLLLLVCNTLYSFSGFWRFIPSSSTWSMITVEVAPVPQLVPLQNDWLKTINIVTLYYLVWPLVPALTTSSVVALPLAHGKQYCLLIGWSQYCAVLWLVGLRHVGHVGGWGSEKRAVSNTGWLVTVHQLLNSTVSELVLYWWTEFISLLK